MNCRPMVAFVSVFCLFSSLHAAGPLPSGWRRPKPAEVPEEWRAKSRNRFLMVRADFDGDGKEDVAELLVSDDGKKFGLWVNASRGTHGKWELLASGEQSLAEIGIEEVKPGKYPTACGKGYGDYACAHGEPDILRPPFPAIDLIYREKADVIYYWNPAAKRFTAVQMGD